jgi:hypothetical protein
MMIVRILLTKQASFKWQRYHNVSSFDKERKKGGMGRSIKRERNTKGERWEYFSVLTSAAWVFKFLLAPLERRLIFPLVFVATHLFATCSDRSFLSFLLYISPCLQFLVRVIT